MGLCNNDIRNLFYYIILKTEFLTFVIIFKKFGKQMARYTRVKQKRLIKNTNKRLKFVVFYVDLQY